MTLPYTPWELPSDDPPLYPPYPLRAKTADEWAEIILNCTGAEFPSVRDRRTALESVKWWLDYRDIHIGKWGKG